MTIRAFAVSAGARAINVVTILALLVGLYGGLVPGSSLAAELEAGDNVVVTTDALNLRSGPGFSAKVILVLQNNDVLKITDGPTSADGYRWYPVDAYVRATVFKGWVSGEFVMPIEQPTGDVTTAFPNGEVLVNTDGLNVRSGPGLAYPVLRVLSRGNAFFAGLSPVRADGYTWYQMTVPNKPALGWVAGEFLVADTGNGTSGSDFQVGDRVVVATDGLNLRSAAGTGMTVVTVLGDGEALTVTGGPTVGNGYTWYAVTTTSGTTGWVAGEFLVHATSGNGIDTVGTQMVVDTSAVNLRSGAGVASPVVVVLSGGTQVMVLSGPITLDGYHWYQVRTLNGTVGWMIGEVLTPA